MKKTLFSIFVAIIAAITINAQVPSGIKYQAVARNTDGAVLANQDVTVQIIIDLGQSPATATVLSETYNVKTNEFGLINLVIGSKNPTEFEAIDWTAGEYFINVKLNGFLMGTSQILSVPYALHAKTAESYNETDKVWTAASVNYYKKTETDPKYALTAHNHSAANITSGTLAIANGGTGATTAAAARTAIGAGTGNGTLTSIATNNGIIGGTITTTGTIGLTGQALALHNLSTTGIIARTGTGTVAARTITAGAGISVTNGNGVSGNPTISANIANASANAAGLMSSADKIKIDAVKIDLSNINTGVGTGALNTNTSGSANTASGAYALQYNTTGHYNTAVGYKAGPTSSSLTNTGAFGYGAQPTASNTIIIGNSSITAISGQVPWTNPSDARFKNNVKENVPGLDFIMKLKPVTFTWDLHKLDSYNGMNESIYTNNTDLEKARTEREKTVCTGFLAQQVEEAANQTNFDFDAIRKPENEKSIYSLAYAEFVVPLVKAVQEQQTIIEKQRLQNEEQQKQIDELTQLVKSLVK